MKRRFIQFALLVAAVAAPASAHADPISILTALQPIVGGTIAAFIASNAATIAATILVGGASIAQRNRLKRKQAAARAAYIANLSDRNVTGASVVPPYRVIYGRAETGGELVDMVTSDKSARSVMGTTLSKPDALKHLIIVWSHRQCQAIHDIKIDGVPVGPLDANGWATGPQWQNANPETLQTSRVAGNLRTATVPNDAVVVSVVLAAGAEASNSGRVPSSGANRWSQSGTTVTLPGTVLVSGFSVTPSAADVWEINYLAKAADNPSGVRVSHHLGAPDQAVDAYLFNVDPVRWTADHRLRGRCYSVITLDLERAQFQGGPPNITADISGALVYDPRSGLTAWSDSPALAQADWLRSELGYLVPFDRIDWSSVIAAANACDEVVNFQVGDDVVSGHRYTCNGVITSDQDKESVRLDLCEAMAGWSHPEGKWRMLAGVWVPPVMDLGDADLEGSIEIMQAGEPSSDLYNGMAGQYIPAGSGTPADFEPYSNATFVAADGRELWKRGADLPFTNSNARCRNLARIAVEQSRNGLVIFFPAKLKAWPLQVGDRVRITSEEYGFAQKVFRINEWSFGLRSPVGLLLQEDGPDAWDEVDASKPDPTPNTTLPDPWVVPPLLGISTQSGTSALIKQSDGTIVSRVRVSWARSTAAYLDSGFIEVRWRPVLSESWYYVNVGPLETEAFITGVQDGSVIQIGVTVVNGLRARSPTVWANEFVVGKLAPPEAITGLSTTRVLGALQIHRDPTDEVDWADTVYEFSTNGGVTWYTVPTVASRHGATWSGPVTGALQIRAIDVDTSGNMGPAATINVTVLPDPEAGQLATWVVATQGNSATNALLTSGLWDDVTKTKLYGAGRSYNVAKIKRSTKVVTMLGTFDVFGGGAPAAASMAAALNSINNDSICVVWSFDEPQTGRLYTDLALAMARNGASLAVFGSMNFQYRSAYILVGIGGCGVGNGAEVYRGDVGNDVNAYCELAFQITPAGSLIVSASKGATSLSDYGYVGTDNMASEAATALRRATNTSAVNLLADGAQTYALNSYTYTAVTDCTVVVRAQGTIEHFSGYGVPGSGSAAFASFAKIVTNSSYHPSGTPGSGDTTLSKNANSVDPYASVPIYLEERFTMTAGQTLTFVAMAKVGGITNTGANGTYVPGAICNVRAGGVMLVEVIKR